jgi:outer membrane protein TolC
MKKFFLLFIFICTTTIGFGNNIKNVAIVTGNSQMQQTLKESMITELKSNFQGTDYEIKIKEILNTKGESLERVLQNLEKKKNIDSIFVLSFNIPANFKTFENNKFISFPLGVVPLQRKFQKNIDYIYGEINFKEDMELFKDLKEIKTIAFVVPDILLKKENAVILKKMVNEMEKAKVNVRVLSIATNKEKFTNELQGVDGIYLLGNGQNVESVIRASYELDIPVFGVDLSQNYDNQILMGYDFSKEINKRTRAAALNYLAYLQNKDDEIINNIGSIQRDVFFNMKIAKKMGIYPNLKILQKVTFVDEEIKQLNYLGFKEAIEIGLKNNPALRSKYQDIVTSEYDVKIANSKRLPQLQANLDYQRVDKDIANALLGQPENVINGKISLNQVIFNDGINANVQINKLNKKVKEAMFAQDQRDYIYNIAVAYLEILQMKAQLDIQKSNYELVKEFLNVAQVKYNLGSSGIQDVYRWESSLSEALSSITRIEGQIIAKEAGLNKLLNLPIENSYEYQSLKEINNSFFVRKNILEQFLYNETEKRKLLSFIMKGAKDNSYQLYQIEKNKEILDRQYLTAKRERYIPQIQAFGEYDKNNVIRKPWGKGSEGEVDDYWKAGVGVVLPLIKGGEIEYTKRQIDSQIKSLDYQKENIENSINQIVAEQFAMLMADYVQTYTTKVGAENARKNLNIVKNLYAQGAVTVTDLVDAKNSSLTAELNEILANYNFLESALGLERIYGEYFILKSPEEQRVSLSKIIKLAQ